MKNKKGIVSVAVTTTMVIAGLIFLLLLGGLIFGLFAFILSKALLILGIVTIVGGLFFVVPKVQKNKGMVFLIFFLIGGLFITGHYLGFVEQTIYESKEWTDIPKSLEDTSPLSCQTEKDCIDYIEEQAGQQINGVDIRCFENKCQVKKVGEGVVKK